MGNPDVFNIEVGQLAETKTFEQGYRGAWFRCKIRDVCPKKDLIKPEYYDFPGEAIIWSKIYEVPSYLRKSKNMKKQQMVRPKYPLMYHRSEMPPVNSISEICVVIDGTWKVGDLVDWHEKDCYWSARVIEVLSNDKVQIELPMAPSGEGGTYPAFCKDLRPSLDWSPEKGWTLPTVEGQISCSAELIFPSRQGIDSERDEVQNAADSPLNASSTSPIPLDLLVSPIEQNTERQTSEIVLQESLQSQEVKIDNEDDVESVTRKASSSDQETQADNTLEGLDHLNDIIDLNIMHEYTLEAAILDLEELVNGINWMKKILENNQLHNETRSYWKLVENPSPSMSR